MRSNALAQIRWPQSIRPDEKRAAGRAVATTHTAQPFRQPQTVWQGEASGICATGEVVVEGGGNGRGCGRRSNCGRVWGRERRCDNRPSTEQMVVGGSVGGRGRRESEEALGWLRYRTDETSIADARRIDECGPGPQLRPTARPKRDAKIGSARRRSTNSLYK